jgi:uncharacterized protein with PIN domain
MAKSKRAKQPRTLAREAARAERRLAADREKLFLLEAGGTPERPREVGSASAIEPDARSSRCPSCNGEFLIDEHVAVTERGVRLREVRVRCRHCGKRRSLWFKITTLAPN